MSEQPVPLPSKAPASTSMGDLHETRTPRKISTASLEPMSGGDHWKDQWRFLTLQSDGTTAEQPQKRVEVGIKKIDQVHTKLVSDAMSYYKSHSDISNDGESFSESMIQLGMYQRRTALGSMLCKYGGLLRMLDTFKEQILAEINELELSKLQLSGSALHEELKSVSTRTNTEEAAIDCIASATGKFEAELSRTLSTTVSKHMKYFEYGYTLFRNLDSEIKRLKEECETFEKAQPGNTTGNSTSHRFPLMTTTIKNDRIQRLFGASLNEAVCSDANEGHAIPVIVEKCLEHIKTFGNQSEGVFRQSGSQGEIERLRAYFEKTTASAITLTEQDSVYDVSSILKAYLRELPNPLMTFELYNSFVQCADILDHGERITKLRATIKLLPKVNRKVLEQLLGVLKIMNENSKQTRMTNETLAIIFAPVLLKPLENQESALIADAGRCFEIISYIITNSHLLFIPDAAPIQRSYQDSPRSSIQLDAEQGRSSPLPGNFVKTRSQTLVVSPIPRGRVVPSQFSRANFSYVVSSSNTGPTHMGASTPVLQLPPPPPMNTGAPIPIPPPRMRSSTASPILITQTAPTGTINLGASGIASISPYTHTQANATVFTSSTSSTSSNGPASHTSPPKNAAAYPTAPQNAESHPERPGFIGFLSSTFGRK